MTFRLPDAWIWDFWFAKDGTTYHLFYLRADRSLGDPALRHANAVICHAASQDLVHWQDIGVCLRPARPPAWDDGPTWTGSIVRRDGVWHMFYTGTSIAEDCKKQRIGLATSRDLHHWDRHPGNPVLDIPPHGYEEYDPAIWHDRAWRDPYVIANPLDGDYRMFLTARSDRGPAEGRGVVAQARSSDLITWHMLPPAAAPGCFGQLEVPQCIKLGHRYYLLFSTATAHIVPSLRDHMAPGGDPTEGTHYFTSDTPDGTWRLADPPLLTMGGETTLYAGKIIHDPAGQPVFVAFRDRDADGRFVGEICDPIPVRLATDGRLHLDHVAPAAPARRAN